LMPSYAFAAAWDELYTNKNALCKIFRNFFALQSKA
jgi:hypothetical protein